MDDEDKKDLLEGFSMSPDWVRKSASEYSSNLKKYEIDTEDGSGKPRHGRSYHGDSRADSRHRRSDSPSAGMPHGHDHSHGTGGGKNIESRRVHEGPLPIDIRFLPEQGALNVIARKIRATCRALPLRDVVRLFFENPDSVEVRLEFNAENRDKRFYQCKECGWFSFDESELERHILSAHMASAFDTADVEEKKPTGNFTSVARCGLSGKLLGPPNHHSFNIAIRRIIATDFPDMSEKEYRAHIETLRDPELVEQWKNEFVRKTVYSRKDSEDKTQFSFEEAENIFKSELLPGFKNTSAHLTLSREATKTLGNKRILDAIGTAWKHEQEAHMGTLFIAVRGGLRSRKIHVFRSSGDRQAEFVVRREPVFLEVTHAVPELKKIMEYISAHPGCTRTELFAALVPEKTAESEAAADEIKKQLAWSTDRGHIVEYFNEVLAMPGKHPFFREVKRPPRKQTKPVDADAPADVSKIPPKPSEKASGADGEITPQAPATEDAAETLTDKEPSENKKESADAESPQPQDSALPPASPDNAEANQIDQTEGEPDAAVSESGD